MRIGIGIGDIAGQPATIDDLVAQAKRAEADGFASGWFANIFGVDAIMGAALVAGPPHGDEGPAQVRRQDSAVDQHGRSLLEPARSGSRRSAPVTCS